MYLFKQKIKVDKTKMSKEVGCSRSYLTSVLNGKRKCSKIVAYCITKYLDKESEIQDFFEREK